MQLVELLDELGFEEAWIGEHHSAGYEIIASPEIFIAIASQRTKHIRLGTGVSSLPYHHPFMLADRINQLDHMTRGRVMFGAGPGSLPTDGTMIGISQSQTRELLEQSRIAEQLAPAIGLSVPVVEVALKRQSYGIKQITESVIADQQQVADTFFTLGLIPKQIRISDAARRPGT